MDQEQGKPKPRPRRSSKRRPTPHNSLISIPPAEAREFPDYPRLGVGGIVVHDGQVLLVRRGREPLKGRWSIPGGLVELGEDLLNAVRREIKEETGIDVEPLETMGVFERIDRELGTARIRYHYVIVDYICRLRGSRGRHAKPPKPLPASDITEAEWVDGDMLSLYELSAEAEDVIIGAMQFVDPDW